MHCCMRATVTIDDRLFQEGDRVARRLKVSRSGLYQRALEAFLRQLRDRSLTAQINAVIERHGQPSDAAIRRHVAAAWQQDMGDDAW